ncbi:MAG: TonB-dependent receptor, partial [Bacteroidota bacterium]
LTSTPINFAIGAPNDFHNTNVTQSMVSLSHEFSDNLTFNTSYMRYGYDEDLFEHRTSNRFAVDSLGEQMPTLMGMRISARETKQVADNVTSYFVWKVTTGAMEHKLLFGYDYFQRVNPVGNASIFTSSSAIYRTVDGGLARYDPAQASNFIFENGLPKPNIPHFDLVNPRYTLGFPSDYILGRSPRPATRLFSNGIYVQDQIDWGSFKILLGLRQEYYNDVINYKQADEENIRQEKLLPRLGLVYSVNEAINVYGTYVQSFQPIGVGTLLDAPAGTTFDPEQGEMIEFGAKATLFRNRLSVNLALYDITNENLIINDPDTGLPTQRGAEAARGFELDVNGRLGANLSITANYAYNDATIEEDDNEALIGERKENAPLHSGGFFVNYGISDGGLYGLNFNVGANFVTERNTFEQALQLPGYSVWDVGVSYKVNRVKLALTLNNIFDETHWVGGYSFVRLFPGAPRHWLLNVSYTF